MDQEVAKTLGELEIKLQELERELTSMAITTRLSVRPVRFKSRQSTREAD